MLMEKIPANVPKTNHPSKPWFEEWFDSPYYQILYSHRNDDEAYQFIHNLTTYLHLKEGQSALDLACGNGRHTAALASFGLKMTGKDLSKESIAIAIARNKAAIEFVIGDIRKPTSPYNFNFVFSLFTSLGYFDRQDDDQAVVDAVYHSLTDHGMWIVDFFNAELVVKNLVPYETKYINNITFNIHKKIEDGYVIKHIEVIDQQIVHNYSERVRLFTYEDFKLLCKNYFDIIDVFGDYQLNTKHIDSPRMILVLSKINTL